jgi:predicted kinase
MLILISGLPGSGKSTVARAYVARYGGTHINSDLVRGDLGLRGQYAPGDKEKVYAAMLSKIRTVLAAGGVAVVDSTFYKKAIRAPFEAVAQDLGLPVVRIQVRAEEALIRRRLQTPRPDSEADFSVYEKIRDAFEPWEQAVLTLWSAAKPLENQLETMHHYIQTNHDR